MQYINTLFWANIYDDVAFIFVYSDATELWALNESTLRKAITYGKIIEGFDVCKFGKQWVVSIKAMQREYGKPKV